MGVLETGVGGRGGVDTAAGVAVADPLFFCRSRLEEMIDFTRRVDALPFKSLAFSIILFERHRDEKNHRLAYRTIV